VPSATILPSLPIGGPIGPCLAVGLAATVGLAILAACWRLVRETTLRSAWGWALASWIGWAVCALLRICWNRAAPTWLPPLEVGAVALSLCPAVSVFGSKRPQHLAWNFVVASLWGVLALPAAESIVLRPGQPLVLGDARGIFLLVLVLLGAVAYLPTRFGLAAILLAVGQAIAVAPYAPLRGFSFGAEGSAAGLAWASAALGVAWVSARWRRPAAHPLDRAWLDFRDMYGLLWGLRVMERLNATASQLGWDVELRWSGFRDRQSGQPLGELPEAQRQALRQALAGLLRRFVSPTWLAQRLEGEATSPARQAVS